MSHSMALISSSVAWSSVTMTGVDEPNGVTNLVPLVQISVCTVSHTASRSDEGTRRLGHALSAR
jgi:hypothetical protein